MELAESEIKNQWGQKINVEMRGVAIFAKDFSGRPARNR